MPRLLLLVPLLLGACSSAESTSERVTTIAALTGDATAGESVYTANCTTCHGTDGKSGSANEDAAGDAAGDPSGAIEQVLNGGGGMTSFESLSDQDVADVIAYLATLD